MIRRFMDKSTFLFFTVWLPLGLTLAMAFTYANWALSTHMGWTVYSFLEFCLRGHIL